MYIHSLFFIHRWMQPLWMPHYSQGPRFPSHHTIRPSPHPSAGWHRHRRRRRPDDTTAGTTPTSRMTRSPQLLQSSPTRAATLTAPGASQPRRCPATRSLTPPTAPRWQTSSTAPTASRCPPHSTRSTRSPTTGVSPSTARCTTPTPRACTVVGSSATFPECPLYPGSTLRPWATQDPWRQIRVLVSVAFVGDWYEFGITFKWI